MADSKPNDKPTIDNAISDQTGQLDARFLLWRAFCSEHDVSVETLPGDLTGEVKAEWERWKDTKLKP